MTGMDDLMAVRSDLRAVLADTEEAPTPCPTCKGSRWVISRPFWAPCPDCGGGTDG